MLSTFSIETINTLEKETKNDLKKIDETLFKSKDILNRYKKEMEELKKEKEVYDVDKLIKKNNGIINFNISGKIFQTTLEAINTVVFDENNEPIFHFLFLLFSGFVNLDNLMDDEGNIFLDRNPKYFRMILNILRDQGSFKSIEIPTDEFKKKEFLKELEFFKIRIPKKGFDISFSQYSSDIFTQSNKRNNN